MDLVIRCFVLAGSLFIAVHAVWASIRSTGSVRSGADTLILSMISTVASQVTLLSMPLTIRTWFSAIVILAGLRFAIGMLRYRGPYGEVRTPLNGKRHTATDHPHARKTDRKGFWRGRSQDRRDEDRRA